MNLRFDNERSTLKDLPKHIRKPLINLYTKYSEGEVQLIDRKWIEIKLNEEQLNIQYFLNRENE